MTFPVDHPEKKPVIISDKRERGSEERGHTPRPFDTSELETIPPATGEDSPYRRWWVIDLS